MDAELPCSTGSSPERMAMVSGAGRSVTRRSLRAVRPRAVNPARSAS